MNKRLLLLIIVSTILYTANIGGTSIYILDEAKNSGCAMEMYHRGDWVVPYFNGALRTDKPPLHYFFMMTAYKVFGVSPFSARLFSSVMGVLTVVVVFLFTRIILNETAAFFSSLILISSIQLAIQFHLAVPDPYLIFFLTTAWLSFYYGHQTGKPFYLYVFYISTSLATLAKGPVAIIFTGLIVFFYVLWLKKFSFRDLLRLKMVEGILIFCVIVLPWYISVGLKTDGVWLQQFFFKHNFDRFTSSMEGHGGFPLASFVILLVGLIPFSFFSPQMIYGFVRDKTKDSFLTFCFISIGVVVLFFALSKTILPTYPEPALPFFSITLGYFIYRVIHEKTVSMLRVNAIVFVLVSLAIPPAAWFAIANDVSLRGLEYLSYYFMVITAGALAGLIFIMKGDLGKAVYSYVISNCIFLLLFFFIVFPVVDQQNPVLQSFSQIKEARKKVVAYRDFNPAYVMACRRTLPEINSVIELVKQDADFVISQKKYMPVLDSLGYTIIFEGKDLFEKPITIIVKK